jgi:hypothetical protein
MVFTLSKELIQDVIEKKRNNVVHEEIIVKDNSEEKYILKYNKKYINETNDMDLGLYRSVVCGFIGGKLEVLSFAPPKSLNKNRFMEENELSKCIQLDFVEGTMVNVFWDKTADEWNINTKSCIGARCSWNSDKTFRFLFLDAMNETQLEFDHLDKKYCYSFVLQHPENKIVVPLTEKKLILTNVYEINNEGENITITSRPDVVKDFKGNNVYQYTVKSFEFWDELLEHYASDNLEYTQQGIVVVNDEGHRMKLRNRNYERVKHLKGNNPKLQFHYYYLRQKGMVAEFLKYYPEYRPLFSQFRNDMHAFTSQLHVNYIHCFIQKQKKLSEYPYQFKPHMYALQEKYINELFEEKKYVNKQVVIDYVNSLPPQRLMYAVNYIYKQHALDTKSVEQPLE